MMFPAHFYWIGNIHLFAGGTITYITELNMQGTELNKKEMFTSALELTSLYFLVVIQWDQKPHVPVTMSPLP